MRFLNTLEEKTTTNSSEPSVFPEAPSDVAAPLLPEKEETEVNATIWSSISNMTNNVLGAGLVALAYSVSQVRSVVLLLD